MNREQTTLLIISDTSDGFDSLVLPQTYKRYARLIAGALRRELNSQRDWEILGRTLVTICHYAKASRHIDVLREVSGFLVSLPVREHMRAIGLYHQAEVLLRTGETDAARVAFEKLATHPQFPWKSRAVASAGTCYFYQGNFETAIGLYIEAQRAAEKTDGDLLTLMESQRMIGAIWNIQGDHDIALKSLESLDPLVDHVAKIHPAIRYDYLNSRAVRLMGLNRLDEAEQLNRITLASPLPKEFFPFHETRDEIREKREAAAATVYVNVAPVPRPEAVLTEQIPDAYRPSIAPEAEASGKSEADIENILPKLEADTSLVTVMDTAELRGLKPEPKPNIKLNSDSKTRIVILLYHPQRQAAAILPSKSRSGLRKLLLKNVAIPDTYRPRAPPIS